MFMNHYVLALWFHFTDTFNWQQTKLFFVTLVAVWLFFDSKHVFFWYTSLFISDKCCRNGYSSLSFVVWIHPWCKIALTSEHPCLRLSGETWRQLSGPICWLAARCSGDQRWYAGGRDGAAVAVLLSQGNTVTCGGWIQGAVSTWCDAAVTGHCKVTHQAADTLLPSSSL